MSTVLEKVEALAERLYGKGAAVSVDREGKGWRVRCWGADGFMRESTLSWVAKADALGVMKRRLERAGFLRLDEEA